MTRSAREKTWGWRQCWGGAGWVGGLGGVRRRKQAFLTAVRTGQRKHPTTKRLPAMLLFAPQGRRTAPSLHSRGRGRHSAGEESRPVGPDSGLPTGRRHCPQARLCGGFGADRAQGKEAEPAIASSVHDTSVNLSGLAGLQKQLGHGHLPEPRK